MSFSAFRPYLLEFVGVFILLVAVLKIGTWWAVGIALAAAAFLFPESLGGFNPLVLGVNVFREALAKDEAIKILAIQGAAAAGAYYVVSKKLLI